MIMKKIFNAFEEKGIQYLHFKSNTNLDESFEGKGDFDVLVDKMRLIEIEQIIESYNGKRHNPVRFGQYPGVDNWLIFDEETGIIYHLHLHFQLATGKAMLKDYVVPWSNLLFETRVRDEKYGIYITDPSLEILLLAVRSVLKSRPSDWIKCKVGAYHLHKSLDQERVALQKQMDPKVVEKYAKILFDEKFVSDLMKIVQKEEVKSRDFRKLTRIVRTSMKYNRRYGALKSNLIASYNQICHLKNRGFSIVFHKCTMVKKTCLSGGLIVAFVGVDGAGKSTTTKEINKWMGKKIECKRFYMGAGDGQTTPFVSAAKKINNMTGKKGSDAGKDGKKISFFKNPLGYVKKFVKMFVIYDVERNNTKKIKTMQRYRLNGGISLLDRYPQIEMEARNDGPKIGQYEKMFGKNIFAKILKKKESQQLEIVKFIKPDLVFRLNISANTSMSRKPEQTDIKEFQQKIDDLNGITFQGAKIIDINAEQPYEQELLEIKRILWKYI